MDGDDLTPTRLHAGTSLGWAGPDRRPYSTARRRAGAAPCWRPRSIRRFDRPGLMLDELSRVLDGACRGDLQNRAYPSAGSLYGIVLLACRLNGGPVWQMGDDGRFEGLDYHQISSPGLRAAVFHQVDGDPWLLTFLANAPLYAARYGARGYRYMLLEAGHLAQEVLRAAAAAQVASCPLGAFDDGAVSRLLGPRPGYLPLYMLALGKAASEAPP